MDYKKWVQVVNFFARKEKETTWKGIDKLKVLKLVWIADRIHLRRYWKTILNDTYFAMDLWPVASWIKNICDQNEEYLSKEHNAYIKQYLEKKPKFIIESKKEVDDGYFSQTNLDILEEVYNKFWSQSNSFLIDFTHKYPEWKKFEENLKVWNSFLMDYKDFFKNIEWQDEIFNFPEEFLEISRNIYEESESFDKLFGLRSV